MRMYDHPRLGHINLDAIARVWVTEASWPSKTQWKRGRDGKLHARAGWRPWWAGGRWHRPNSWIDHGRYFDRAELMVQFTGAPHPIRLGYDSTKEALAARDELLGVIG